MNHSESNIDALRNWIWRPHPAARFGTIVALILAVSSSVLLIFSSDAVVAFFREHPVGGMVGSAKAEDQLLGLSIVAGFGWLMSAVGGAINLHALRNRSKVMKSLSSPDPGAIVWIYQELTQVDSHVEHVLTFALRNGSRVRATVPADQVETLWQWALDRCPDVSIGHDTTQERVFAVSPKRMTEAVRKVEGIQRLSHHHRAR
ncbi:MAG TPA: hypothetical protein DCQ06_08825 [Myxococcales bacterium]|nr:hypothetical protein [Myxococcales bacterium]